MDHLVFFVFSQQLLKKGNQIDLHTVAKLSKLIFKMALSYLWNLIWVL